MKYPSKQVEDTIKTWQPYYLKQGIILSEQDAIEIIDNMTAYINLLAVR